jgi:hypothetical protein
MPSVATLSVINGAPNLHVDLAALETPMKKGINRASAFLGSASTLPLDNL